MSKPIYTQVELDDSLKELLSQIFEGLCNIAPILGSMGSERENFKGIIEVLRPEWKDNWYVPEKEFIGTFGSNHHTTAVPDKVNAFVVIWARTDTGARSKMFAEYDAKWAFIYPSRDKAGVEKYNLTKIEFGE